MRAWVVQEFGSPSEVLRIEDVTTRTPGPDEVVVDLRAVSLGFADLLLCAGLYQIRPEPPFTPGFEGVGVVSAIGSNVHSVAIGDRVLALPDPGEGTLREQTVIAATRAYPVPESMDDDAAAGFFVPYHTAHMALHRRARLQPGETLLVLGGAGGVGLAAIELAKVVGATVFATAGGPEKVALCERHGADRAIDYKSEDLRTVIKDLTAGRGVDVVMDMVGGELFEQARRLVAPEGRMLIIGFASGETSSISTSYLLVKNFSVIGVFYGPGSLQEQVGVATHADLLRLHSEDRIHPVIAEQLAFDEAPAGLDRLATGSSHGKLIIHI